MDQVQQPPLRTDDLNQVVDQIIAQVGPNIVLGLPLGLGKACTIANALYQRACDDPDISVTFLTALTLEAPTTKSLLAQRFLDPIADSIFAGYPELAYAKHARAGTLPKNVQVKEFFLSPGKWLGAATAQQSYISVNYTHALSALLTAGMNVIAQIISAQDPHPNDPYPLSLSCNPDITVDLLDLIQRNKAAVMVVGHIHRDLPFMEGKAACRESDFDLLYQSESDNFPLFKIPLEPVAAKDHAIGLQVAALVKDGGTLQIGIGAIGDAICHALSLRHQQPEQFTKVLRALQPQAHPLEAELGPFQEGLYACTEMLVDGLLSLLEKGILKREVDGCSIHAGFFVGSPTFHKQLTALPQQLRDRVGMMPVSYTNSLLTDEAAKRRARQHGRFINSTMMITLLGHAVSDGLENGQVVSGVGGQHDFMTQAHALEGARAILTLPATRVKGRKTYSNIVWNYGHSTIPRHLKDIVITEYGSADLRHQSDAEVIKRLLAITDSRFQGDLLATAKKAGKIAADYEIPRAQQHNTPARIATALGGFKAELPRFPLGTTFTPVEQDIAGLLSYLAPRASSKRMLLRWAKLGLGVKASKTQQAVLARLQLEAPNNWTERFYQKIVLGALIELAN